MDRQTGDINYGVPDATYRFWDSVFQDDFWLISPISLREKLHNIGINSNFRQEININYINGTMEKFIVHFQFFLNKFMLHDTACTSSATDYYKLG